MLVRGHFVCQCTALYMMVLYDRARVGPTTKTSDRISIICLFRLILQAKSFVLFYLWYSSCFKVKCRIHTFHKWCSHISMGVLILLDHWGCHVNSFPNRCVSLQVDLIISTFVRSILSFLNGIHSIRPKLPLSFWRYLKRIVFPFLIRSSYLEIVISFKPFNSTGAISLLNRSTLYLLSGP